MAFRASPGITITEEDFTGSVPPVATLKGGIGGVFTWGPINEPVTVTTETELVANFGAPSALNYETFMTAASFLAYSRALTVVRGANTTGNSTNVANTTLSGVANIAAVTNSHMLTATVKNLTDYESKDGTFNSNILYIAKYPGVKGNSLKISVCDSADAYSSSFSLVSNSNLDANSAATFAVGSNTANVVFLASGIGTNADTYALATSFVSALTVGDIITAGNSTIGEQRLKVSSVGSVTSINSTAHYVSVSFVDKYILSTDYSSNTVNRAWEYFNLVDRAPQQSATVTSSGNTSAVDGMHIAVVDSGGAFTGAPGTVLEVFNNVSRATDSKKETGEANYYKTVLNDTSKYVWFGNDRSGAASANALNVASSTNTKPLTLTFANGTDGNTESTIPLAVVATAYDQFRLESTKDVALLMQGKALGGVNGTGLANYLIALAQAREPKDLMVFISPEYSDVVNASGNEVTNVTAFRNSLTNTSYAVLDSGYKYAYDRYSDVYRWIPLNGDVAGLVARTEQLKDAWWSPAGFNRGQILNAAKLAWDPNETQADSLYRIDINPVKTFSGQGTVLFGDKTLLGKPSAFDRINVRRLFILVEKAVSLAAQSTLFEANDDFTRAQFRNAVEPFLRTIKGRRGITDFRVVCDATNNTADVIDRNEFVGDIYIKPTRSINFIRLNFRAVGSGIEFSEIVSGS